MRGDWILTYPGVVLPFGSIASGYGFDAAPDVGVQSVVADDFSPSGDDGRLFGVDTLDTDVVTFAIDIMAPSELEARTLHDRIRGAWRGDAIRKDPGAVAMLVSEAGRSTFGRPRRFSANTDLIHAGVVRVTADFAPATDLWFGDVESVSVGLVPLPEGGLVAPLAAPLLTTESSDRSQVVTVTGERPTWPTVTIYGPITNPVVELGPVRWELRTSLAYDQTLTVDASPWARTILRDGAGVPGVLTPQSTRLAKALLPPGEHEFVLRGASSTGTARAVASWRPAFHTP